MSERKGLVDKIGDILAPAIDRRAPYAKVMIDMLADLLSSDTKEYGPIVWSDETMAAVHRRAGGISDTPADAWRVSFQGGGCSYYTEKPTVFPEASLTPLYVLPTHPGKETA